MGTRGIRLTKIDLSMNKAIPKKLLEELTQTIQRNKARTEKIKDSFMKMFRNICRNQDMAGEMNVAIEERRQLYKNMLVAKEKNQNREVEILEMRIEVQTTEQDYEDQKHKLDKFIHNKQLELDDIAGEYQQREKVRLVDIEK